ncbi:MAG: hypothetical protein O2968_17260, partial [Acidobacteria bacterium]|nr:hypothetical protein [Acidobacteriota bacterium]
PYFVPGLDLPHFRIILGLENAPFTTLGYAWAINMYGTVEGAQAIVVVIALLLDLGVFGGGAVERRRRR